MEKVRIGVIGLGGMGTATARWLHNGEAPGLSLTAICDIDESRLDWGRKEFGAKIAFYPDAERLFAARCLDAVYIATPHYFHPPLAMKAFAAGLHVLTEKPAGVYTQQVRKMNEAARKSGKVFAIMFMMRCAPVYRKLRDLVQSGEVGKIMRTNWIATAWFRSQSYYDSGGWRATWAGEGGGVLLNQCPHNLDLWQWICGLPCRVRAFGAFGKYHRIEVEDDVTAYVEYPDGATGVFIATTGESPGTNRLEISCDRGKVVLENDKITFWRTRQPVSKFCAEYKGGFGDPECWETHIPTPGQDLQHIGILRNFADAILKKTPLIAPGEEGIRSLNISNAIYLSLWTDDWVKIPVDEKRFLAELKKRVAKSRFKKNSGSVLDVKTSW